MKFKVAGMTCSHCVRSITHALQSRDPAARVDVDLAAGTVTVEGALDEPAARAAAEGYVVAAMVAPTESEAAACCGHCHD